MADSTEVRFARLLRPFPVKRLADKLYHVQAASSGIDMRLRRILEDPPTLPEAWRFELDALATDLWDLADRCKTAQEAIEVMTEDAQRQYDVAVDAMQAAMRGMRDAA